MASVVRQTLYPYSGRTPDNEVFSGLLYNISTQTEEEAHDNDIFTFDGYGIRGTGVAIPNGIIGLFWALTNCTYQGTIDKLRVYIKASCVKNGDVNTPNISITCGQNVLGTPQNLTTSPAWYTFDVLDKSEVPNETGPWTYTFINSVPFGWAANISGDGETENDSVECYVYEYYIEVWGEEEVEEEVTNEGGGIVVGGYWEAGNWWINRVAE